MAVLQGVLPLRSGVPLLAAVWLAQLGLAVVVPQLDPPPRRPLLIERRSCAPGQWEALVRRYRPLHWQHQLRQQRLAPVIAYGVLAEELLAQPPSPAELLQSPGVGASPRRRREELRRRFPDAVLLRCD
jgi:hypothetical protein